MRTDAALFSRTTGATPVPASSVASPLTSSSPSFGLPGREIVPSSSSASVLASVKNKNLYYRASQKNKESTTLNDAWFDKRQEIT